MNTMSTQHELPTLVVLNGYLARVLLAHQGSSEMVAEFVIEGAPAPDWNGCHQDRFSVRLLADLIGFARRLGTVAAAQVGNSGGNTKCRARSIPICWKGNPTPPGRTRTGESA